MIIDVVTNQTGVAKYIAALQKCTSVPKRTWWESQGAVFQFGLLSLGLIMLFGFVAFLFVYDASRGGYVFTRFLLFISNLFALDPTPATNFPDYTSIELTQDLVANYLAVIGALSVAFAGALVAIKISENTHNLQKQANETANKADDFARNMERKARSSEASKLYYKHYRDSIKVYQDLSRQIAGVCRNANFIAKIYEEYLLDDEKWYGVFDSKELANSAKEDILTQKNVSIERHSKFIDAVNLYKDSINELSTTLRMISEDSVLTRQWAVSYLEPVTEWHRTWSAMPLSGPNHQNILDLDYLSSISISNFLETYIKRLSMSDLIIRLNNIVDIDYRSTEKFSLTKESEDSEEIKVIEGYELWHFFDMSFPGDIEGMTLAGEFLIDRSEFMYQSGDVEEKGVEVSSTHCIHKLSEGVELFVNLFCHLPNEKVIDNEVRNFIRDLGYTTIDKEEFDFKMPFDKFNYFSGITDSKVKFLELVSKMRTGEFYDLEHDLYCKRDSQECKEFQKWDK